MCRRDVSRKSARFQRECIQSGTKRPHHDLSPPHQQGGDVDSHGLPLPSSHKNEKSPAHRIRSRPGTIPPGMQCDVWFAAQQKPARTICSESNRTPQACRPYSLFDVRGPIFETDKPYWFACLAISFETSLESTHLCQTSCLRLYSLSGDEQDYRHFKPMNFGNLCRLFRFLRKTASWQAALSISTQLTLRVLTIVSIRDYRDLGRAAQLAAKSQIVVND